MNSSKLGMRSWKSMSQNVNKGSLVLFLDDSITRHDCICSQFDQKPQRWDGQLVPPDIANIKTDSSYSIIHAFRVHQAKYVLSNVVIDILYLDNDLVQNGGPEEEGRSIVNFIETLKPDQRPKWVIIHTSTTIP